MTSENDPATDPVGTVRSKDGTILVRAETESVACWCVISPEPDDDVLWYRHEKLVGSMVIGAVPDTPAAAQYARVHFAAPADWIAQVRDVADVAGQIHLMETWITPDTENGELRTVMAELRAELSAAPGRRGPQDGGAARLLRGVFPAA
jgi:hypothetical protein